MNAAPMTRYEREFGVPYVPSTHSLAGEVNALMSGPAFNDADAWRFVIGQALDDYESRKSWGTLEHAIAYFQEEPALTGHTGIDAAVAGLAAHLATRDGWDTPAWATNPARQAVTPWFVSRSVYARKLAREESPREFRARGVYVTRDALARA